MDLGEILPSSIQLHSSDHNERGQICQTYPIAKEDKLKLVILPIGYCLFDLKLYRVIPSVLDPREWEYLKDYSLFNLIFCKYILYL
jgi:hypothetical protein